MSKVLLLSGGIDSSSLAAWVRPDMAVVVDYGQVSALGEIRAAKSVAESLELPLHVLKADCRNTGSGLLSGNASANISPSKEWWPFRNQLLITLVGAWAINHDYRELLVGAVRTDSYHVDGTKRFFEAINSLMSMQEGNIKVSTPAIELTPVDLVKASGISPEILGWTHSCHRGEWACGTCPGCIKHEEVMFELMQTGFR